jgi:hypothetical protein
MNTTNRAINRDGTLGLQAKADIYSAWSKGLAPSIAATTLGVALTVVIAEYVRLDDLQSSFKDKP